MSAPAERALAVETADGVQLDGLLHEHRSARLAALVLHPHPAYGGDMRNHVVQAICATLAQAGASTLRFNLRAVNSGVFDSAEAASDARAALDELRALAASAPLLFAGYSLGAQMAAGLAASEPCAAAILVSPPLAMLPLPEIPAGLATLAVAGDADPVCPAERLRGVAAPRCAVRLVPGMDHGWSGGTDELTAAIASFVSNPGI
ncbi:MAG: hypothetical protein IVW36_02420 [Dehalococcoidia bacterium]|nr:hypothetical protein [Dehalococcoidia bacterium]